MRLYLVTVLTILSLLLIPHPIINAPTPSFAAAGDAVHSATSAAKNFDPTFISLGDSSSTFLNAGDNLADHGRQIGSMSLGAGRESTSSSPDVLNSMRGTDNPLSSGSTATRTEPIADMSKNADATKMGEAPHPFVPTSVSILERLRGKPFWKAIGNKVLLPPVKVPYKMTRAVFRKITDFRLKGASDLLHKYEPEALTPAKIEEVWARKQKIIKLGQFFRSKMDERAWVSSTQNTKPFWATSMKDTSAMRWVDKVKNAFKGKPAGGSPKMKTVRLGPGPIERLKSWFKNPFKSSSGTVRTEVANKPVFVADDMDNVHLGDFGNPTVLGSPTANQAKSSNFGMGWVDNLKNAFKPKPAVLTNVNPKVETVRLGSGPFNRLKSWFRNPFKSSKGSASGADDISKGPTSNVVDPNYEAPMTDKDHLNSIYVPLLHDYQYVEKLKYP